MTSTVSNGKMKLLALAGSNMAAAEVDRKVTATLNGKIVAVADSKVASASSDGKVAALSGSKVAAVSSENCENNGDNRMEELKKLTVKELKELCKEQGLKLSGNKTELAERLENPEQAHAKRAKTSRGMTADQVHAALKSAGYSNPEHTASACSKKAIQKGYISLQGGLDKTVFKGSCQNCGEDVSCTLRGILEQPDYAGCDYEDGGTSGAVQCEGEECSGMYLTRMCEGKLELDSGKFHNHCTQCKGFGKCIGDYREAHCQDCGKHYFTGLSGFACSCKQSGFGCESEEGYW
jgi:hypothetical protein